MQILPSPIHAAMHADSPAPRLTESPLEGRIDRLTRVTSAALNAPITFFSGIDFEREMYWSSIADEMTRAQLPSQTFERSFARQVIEAGESVVVENAGEHPAMKRGEWFPEFGATSFAGVPLLDTEGRTLGAVCVADRIPRLWSTRDLDILRAVAASAAAEIELHATAVSCDEQQDIAETERREKAALLACIAEGVYAVGKDGYCSFVNPCAASMLGYSAAELLGADIHALIHPSSGNGGSGKHECSLLRATRSESQVHDEEVFWRRDGSSFPVTFSAAPLVEGDDLSGTVVTFADITERRRAEEELRESHHLLNAIIEGTSDAVFVKGLDGRYLMINTAGAKMMDRPVGDVFGKSDDELFAPPIASEFAKNDGQTLAGGGPRTHEEVAMVGQEKRFWLTTKTIYRGDAGEVRGLIGIARDVTEHRALEQQLRQSQKIEAIGRLAGGIAHDFNNLLAIIKSYSDFLMRDLDVADERRADVKEIRDAADRAAALTRQLLVFSRRQHARSSTLDLNDVVEGLDTMLRRLIPASIELRTSLAPLVGYVRADRGQLEQVILNLVVNARDAMPDGGVLELITEKIDLDESAARMYAGVPPGNYVSLAVSDSGLGMDSETLSRVFEPFFTTKDFGRGTGLGMSIVYGILKASDAHIIVDSAVRGGTMVRVFFPRFQEQSPAGIHGDGKSITSRSGTILVVEDEAFVRNALVAILEREGYRVLEACDSADARRISRESRIPIDLLISEVLLPGMTGRQVTEEIVAERPNTEVVYISPFSEKSLARRQLIPSGARVISKPFHAEDLLKLVDKVLANRRSSRNE